ncbi:MAG: tRNA pseudouridine(38-40) synthase TruA [Euryarchaeota archaeon]|nr:tRNA pseudouridine(38-40) synthase TruA [Euryarchaeota archaeon]
MPRYALKVAYDGMAFNGSQRQPEPARTVELDVTKAARELGILGDEDWFVLGSRTDAGVSALGNVGALDTEFDEEALVPALNSQLEEVWAHGMARVSNEFNPRFARSRWYRYLIEREGLDVKKAEEAARLFSGEHDFTRFSKLDDTADRSPVRRIDSIEVIDKGGFLAIDVRGESFLWQMVRRIAGAVRKVAAGEVYIDIVKSALHRPKEYQGESIAPLPPEGLWLMDTRYDFDFAPEPLPERFQRARLQSKLKGMFYEEVAKTTGI